MACHRISAQAITRSNAEQNLWDHMTELGLDDGLNELEMFELFSTCLHQLEKESDVLWNRPRALLLGVVYHPFKRVKYRKLLIDIACHFEIIRLTNKPLSPLVVVYTWSRNVWICTVYIVSGDGLAALSDRQCSHCSRSQDIDLFKFQLSYCYKLHKNPLQDTCTITSAVLGHLMRSNVPLIFLHRNKKSYWLSEKCATLDRASVGKVATIQAMQKWALTLDRHTHG